MRSLKAVHIVSALLALLCAGASVQAAVVYSQNFNSYDPGTLLTAVPGWYDNGGGDVPTIVNGKVFSGAAGADMLFNLTDLFSYGNTQATVEFDMASIRQNDVYIAPGSAAGYDISYTNMAGIEHAGTSTNFLYTFNQTNASTDYKTVASFTGEKHWAFIFTKALNSTSVTWSATYDGTSFFWGAGTRTFFLSSGQTLNTMEWIPTVANSTLDNLVITASPEPATMSLLALGALAILRRNRK